MMRFVFFLGPIKKKNICCSLFSPPSLFSPQSTMLFATLHWTRLTLFRSDLIRISPTRSCLQWRQKNHLKGEESVSSSVWCWFISSNKLQKTCFELISALYLSICLYFVLLSVYSAFYEELLMEFNLQLTPVYLLIYYCYYFGSCIYP